MLKRFFNLHADSAGFFTSLLCAIHCSAIPIMISFGLIGSGSWLHNHLFDWIIISIGIIIAGYAIVGDYFKKHKKPLPIIVAGIGFSFLLIGMIDHHGWMLVFSVLGGLLVASSHVLNWRYTQTCKMSIL